MDWKKLLLRSKYSSKAQCISAAFIQASINSFKRLDNAPAKFGTTLCGVSTYELVAELYLVSKTDGKTTGKDDPEEVAVIAVDDDEIITAKPLVKRKAKEMDNA